MRRIETSMCQALLAGKGFSRNNTRVVTRTDTEDNFHHAKVYLFGNEICHYYENHEEGSWVLRLTDAGWDTVTTRSRLNALLEKVGKGDRLSVYRVNGKTRYQMGANEYEWMGTHTFLAISPTEGK